MPLSPTVTVEFGFDAAPDVAAAFHLDDATFGVLDDDVLAEAQSWSDVSDYVFAFSTQRGVSRVDGPVLRMEAGTATVVLDNSDRRFDPTNLDGPYTAGGITQVEPMRGVRISATYLGSTYWLFTGYVDSWQIDYAGLTSDVTVTATDGFKVLSDYDRIAQVTPVGASELSGARVNRILDSVAWPDELREIDAGDSTLIETTLDGAALTELFLVADSEIGELYMRGDGVLRFRERSALLTETRSTTSQALFGDYNSSATGDDYTPPSATYPDPLLYPADELFPEDGAYVAPTNPELEYSNVTVVYDDATMANLVQVSNEGGTQQTLEDAGSRQEYLTHTFNRTDLLLTSDAAALQYAAYILSMAARPELRFGELTLDPQGDDAFEALLYPQVLGREIGDRITVRRRPPGGGSVIEREVYVRGIRHDVDARQNTWGTSWQLQSTTGLNSIFILDSATFGVLDEDTLGF